MKKPPLNTSPEAVRLRNAAAAWGKSLEHESLDDEDREGQRLNRELLRAACAYHNAVQADAGIRLAPPPKGQGHDAAWLREQLRELAKSASNVAKADRAAIKRERNDWDQRFLEGSADATDYFAREIRRILAGRTRAADLRRRFGAHLDEET